MGMAELVLFDDGCPTLTPVCDLQASFDLRTGALTTMQRIARQIAQPPGALVVRPYLAPLIASRHHLPINRPPDHDVLLINGRWSSIDSALPTAIDSAIIAEDGTLLAALLDARAASKFIECACRLPDGVTTTSATGAKLIRHPWDVLLHARANLAADIDAMSHLHDYDPPSTIVVIGDRPVRVGSGGGGGVIDPLVVLDTSGGPIAIDEGAHIHAHCIIEGPCYIGCGATINARAHIRANTVVGPSCKIGGEVGACVFQGFSNKGHTGYLGDSYVGEWVNLGAGTTTSNLKNTYGQVKMQVTADGEPQPTGMVFLGSIIGDHVKTAIGTRLLTGTCIGTGAMVALSGFTPKYVPPFAFVTDGGVGGAVRYDLERFCLVADRVMQRRGQRVNAELTQTLAALHQRTV